MSGWKMISKRLVGYNILIKYTKNAQQPVMTP